MRLSGIIAMAVLLGMAGGVASAQTCTPITVGKAYTTSDNGNGPYDIIRMGGSATATGAYTQTGSGFGPGYPNQNYNNPSGYNANLLSVGSGYFSAEARIHSLSSVGQWPAGGTIAINSDGTIWTWGIRTHGSGNNPGPPSIEMVSYTPQGGGYTENIIFSSLLSNYGGYPFWMLLERTSSSTYNAYYAIGNNNWVLLASALGSDPTNTQIGTYVASYTTSQQDIVTASIDGVWLNGAVRAVSDKDYGVTNGVSGTAIPSIFQAGQLTVGPDPIYGYVDVRSGIGGCQASWGYELTTWMELKDTTTNTILFNTVPSTTATTQCGNVPSCAFSWFSPYGTLYETVNLTSGHSYTLYDNMQGFVPGGYGGTSQTYTTTMIFSVP